MANVTNSLKVLVQDYLASQDGVWSPTTMKSEKSRLTSTVAAVEGLPVDEAWRRLGKLFAPYARVTAWVRLSAVVTWAQQRAMWEGPNVYAEFKRRNPRMFKAAYKRRPCEFSFDEVGRRIAEIDDPHVQHAARTILMNGLRAAELATLKDGRVTGKGGEERDVLFNEELEHDVSYKQLWTALKKVGLKPHDLRKALAQELANRGANEHDLMKVMGWKRYETAMSYVAPKKMATLRKMISDTDRTRGDEKPDEACQSESTIARIVGKSYKR